MKIQFIVRFSALFLLGIVSTPRLEAQSFTKLHSFSYALDGANPGGLVVSGGRLLGTTLSGGSSGGGTVYACSTNGSGMTALHLFSNTPDGAAPQDLLLLSNTLYGMTRSGGIYGWGTVFKLSPDGTGYSVLHSFTNLPDGGSPSSSLVGEGNTLYGTVALGGNAGNGIVFRMDTNGANYTALHVFTNTPDGANPYAGLILSGTNLYGTTYNGGLYGRGTVFKLATNGAAFSILYNFGNLPDAAFPYGKLILVNNALYGTTSSGGNSGAGGTIFSLNVNGTGYTILHHFTGPTTPSSNSDGGSPKAGLIYSSGILYGDTSGGGAGDGGTVFQMNLNGTGFAVLKNLSNATDGSIPQAALVLNDYGNTLFGATYFGPDIGDGTLFSFLLAPAISGQPQSATVTSGNPATFTVNAGGQSPLAYQWYYNANTGNPNLLGSSLGGQTGSTLTFTAAAGSGGYYSVIITNIFGAVTSSPALLTVSATLVKPAITAQPQPANVTNGFTANFSVSAGGSNPLFYQWYFNANTGNPNLLGTGLGGQTGSTLSFTVGSGSGGYYSVIVSNTAGAVTSSPALLTVLPAVTKPSITAQPQPQNVTNGLTANFSVTATGSAPLNYQWYFNANTGNPGLLGTSLGGQNGSTLSFTATTNNSGYYSVVVANSGGAATSSPALLTVIVPIINAKPQILAQPQGLNVTNGDTANFNVVATNGSLTYQWYFNTSTVLANETGSSLAIDGTATSDAGTYSVVVANDFGSVTSSPATLTVYSNTKPIITQQPQDIYVTSGDAAYVSVTAVGQPPLRYQWYFNTTGGATGTVLAGQTNSFRSFTPSTANSGNYYFVVITNALGKVTSSPPALLTVITKPTIMTNPQPLTVNAGDTATFTVSALGLSLQYQWYSNSIASALGTLLPGQTGSTYSFTGGLNANGSYYSVVITNSLGRATSSPALLTVTSPPAITITLQPVDKTITNGDPVSFTAAASGSGLSYQWYFETNVLIAGATSPTLAFATANQPGMYSVKVTSGSTTVTSRQARLTVVGRPIMVSAQFVPASGSYAFSYVNLAGSTNRLWASTNLAATSFWRAIATNTMATNALWFVTDPNAAKTNKACFYRFSTP